MKDKYLIPFSQTPYSSSVAKLAGIEISKMVGSPSFENPYTIKRESKPFNLQYSSTFTALFRQARLEDFLTTIFANTLPIWGQVMGIQAVLIDEQSNPMMSIEQKTKLLFTLADRTQTYNPDSFSANSRLIETYKTALSALPSLPDAEMVTVFDYMNQTMRAKGQWKVAYFSLCTLSDDGLVFVYDLNEPLQGIPQFELAPGCWKVNWNE